MWTVILVEDEELVRGFIRKNVPWEQLGFRIVGEASNGKEAMDTIHRLSPDLIIADIMMPVMDGVDLLKLCRSEGNEAMFIMLTCVNDFAYAREALEYGASNYILKLSMTSTALKEVLAKAGIELTRRYRQKWQQNQLEYHRYYDNMWKQMNSLVVMNEQSQPLMPNLGLREMHQHVVVLSVLSGRRKISHIDLEETAGKDAFVHSYVQEGVSHFFIWISDDSEWLGLPAVKAWELNFSWALCMDPQQLVQTWKSVYSALHRHWYELQSGNSETLFGTIDTPAPAIAVIDATVAVVKSMPHEYTFAAASQGLAYPVERDIVLLFESLQLEECLSRLEEQWLGMAERYVSLHNVKEVSLRLNRLAASLSGDPESGSESLQDAINHQQLLASLKLIFRQHIEALQRKRGLWTDHSQINLIIRYVHDHYDQVITLESMAKYVAMDMYYLSGLFKKKTQESFIHFLQKVRVEKAKTYLSETKWSLSEIAEKVGFVQDNYLTKIFKRWTGLTPGEYRKACKKT
jgi:two-component system response regulator YesN